MALVTVYTRVCDGVCGSDEDVMQLAIEIPADRSARSRHNAFDMCGPCRSSTTIAKQRSEVTLRGSGSRKLRDVTELSRPLPITIEKPTRYELIERAAGAYCSYLQGEANRQAEARASRKFLNAFQQANGNIRVRDIGHWPLQRMLERGWGEPELIELANFLSWCRWQGYAAKTFDPLADLLPKRPDPFGGRRKPSLVAPRACAGCRSKKPARPTSLAVLPDGDGVELWLCPSCERRTTVSDALLFIA